jgi:hypothetical protein
MRTKRGWNGGEKRREVVYFFNPHAMARDRALK